MFDDLDAILGTSVPSDPNDIPALVRKYAKQFGVDEELALKIANQESRYNPKALSPKGARGVMQLMPDTARKHGLDPDRMTVEENIWGGMKEFREQLDKYGDVPTALAAYNAGPGAVDKYKGIPPYRETKDYIKKITGQDAPAGGALAQGSIRRPTYDDIDSLIERNPPGGQRPRIVQQPSHGAPPVAPSEVPGPQVTDRVGPIAPEPFRFMPERPATSVTPTPTPSPTPTPQQGQLPVAVGHQPPQVPTERPFRMLNRGQQPAAPQDDLTPSERMVSQIPGLNAFAGGVASGVGTLARAGGNILSEVQNVLTPGMRPEERSRTVGGRIGDMGRSMQADKSRLEGDAGPLSRYTLGTLGNVIGAAPAVMTGAPLPAAMGLLSGGAALDEGYKRAAIEGAKGATLGALFGGAMKTLPAAKPIISREVSNVLNGGLGNLPNAAVSVTRDVLAQRLVTAGVVGSTAAAMQIADDVMSTGKIDVEKAKQAGIPAAIISAFLPGQRAGATKITAQEHVTGYKPPAEEVPVDPTAPEVTAPEVAPRVEPPVTDVAAQTPTSAGLKAGDTITVPKSRLSERSLPGDELQPVEITLRNVSRETVEFVETTYPEGEPVISLPKLWTRSRFENTFGQPIDPNVAPPSYGSLRPQTQTQVAPEAPGQRPTLTQEPARPFEVPDVAPETPGSVTEGPLQPAKSTNLLENALKRGKTVGRNIYDGLGAADTPAGIPVRTDDHGWMSQALAAGYLEPVPENLVNVRLTPEGRNRLAELAPVYGTPPDVTRSGPAADIATTTTPEEVNDPANLDPLEARPPVEGPGAPGEAEEAPAEEEQPLPDIDPQTVAELEAAIGSLAGMPEAPAQPIQDFGLQPPAGAPASPQPAPAASPAGQTQISPAGEIDQGPPLTGQEPVRAKATMDSGQVIDLDTVKQVARALEKGWHVVAAPEVIRDAERFAGKTFGAPAAPEPAPSNVSPERQKYIDERAAERAEREAARKAREDEQVKEHHQAVKDLLKHYREKPVGMLRMGGEDMTRNMPNTFDYDYVGEGDNRQIYYYDTKQFKPEEARAWAELEHSRTQPDGKYGRSPIRVESSSGLKYEVLGDMIGDRRSMDRYLPENFGRRVIERPGEDPYLYWWDKSRYTDEQAEAWAKVNQGISARSHASFQKALEKTRQERAAQDQADQDEAQTPEPFIQSGDQMGEIGGKFADTDDYVTHLPENYEWEKIDRGPGKDPFYYYWDKTKYNQTDAQVWAELSMAERGEQYDTVDAPARDERVKRDQEAQKDIDDMWKAPTTSTPRYKAPKGPLPKRSPDAPTLAGQLAQDIQSGKLGKPPAEGGEVTTPPKGGARQQTAPQPPAAPAVGDRITIPYKNISKYVKDTGNPIVEFEIVELWPSGEGAKVIRPETGETFGLNWESFNKLFGKDQKTSAGQSGVIASPQDAPGAASAAPDGPQTAGAAEMGEEMTYPSPISGTKSLIDEMYKRLKAGESFNNPQLTAIANQHYGGTTMEGKYEPKHAWDAVEAAVNKIIAEMPGVMTDSRRFILPKLRSLLAQLPTQRSDQRSVEMQELQQFSTPPQLAYIAARALNPQPEDTVLEPSAGTGSLAAFAKAAGADVRVNEKSARRREILEYLGYPASDADAEFLNSTLPSYIKPTAILMNPPFSATGGRVKTNANKFGVRHIKEALARLQPGGRLVAILGEGMAADKKQAKAFWGPLSKQYNIRANVGIDGKEYAKYGTTFGNVLVIIDKDGPTTQTVTGSFKTVEDAYEAIKDIAADRKAPAVSDLPAAPEVAQGEMGATSGGVGAGSRGTRTTSGGGGGGGGSRKRSGTADQNTAKDKTATAPEPAGEEGEPEAVKAPRKPKQDDKRGAPEPSPRDVERARIEQQKAHKGRKDFAGGKYTEYVPAKVLGGTKPATVMVESQSLASVDPPNPTYVPQLASDIMNDRLYNFQVETPVYAGQRHEMISPDGTRLGFLLGDGTGAGKGRQIAAVIIDNWNQGRRRIVWMTKNDDLEVDSRQYLDDTGGAHIPLINQKKFKGDSQIELNEGVIHTTYTTLVVGVEGDEGGPRYKQLKDWLGDDGVIIFDESHIMKNAIKIGRKKPSKAGRFGRKLQKDLPKARVMYASATAATDVGNFAYMDRLGLWGQKASFKDFNDFHVKIASGGVTAMEMVAKELKAQGAFVARTLSYDGVKYSTVIHKLDDGQREMYDASAVAWRTVLENINDAFTSAYDGDEEAAKEGVIKSLSQYWSAQQRFYRQVITSFKVPKTIELTEKALKENKQVVISLINTGDSRAQDAVNNANAAGDDLEDLDMSPLETIKSLVEKAMPTAKRVEQSDENGNLVWVILRDPQTGNVVEDPELVRNKKALLDKLEDLRLPESPLDQLINYFEERGVKVAELTSREKKLVRNKETGAMEYKSRGEGVAMDKINKTQRKEFQDGKRRIAVISQAAAEGISLHSQIGTPTEDRQRVQITLQIDWSADKQMQTFGRTHRNNQKTPPEFVLMATDVGGEARFLATIARRLATLGALTRGQRDAAGAGDELQQYNFESETGEGALTALYNKLMTDQPIKGLEVSGQEALVEMGLAKIDEGGNFKLQESAWENVGKFLNRILSLELDKQNAIFDAYVGEYRRIDDAIRERGETDEVGNIEALSIEREGEPQVIRIDPVSGGETYYHKLKVEERAQINDFVEASDISGFFRNKKTGKLARIMRTGTETDPRTQRVENRVTITTPVGAKEYTTEREAYDRYEPRRVPDAEARKEWAAALAEAPKTVTRTRHLVTGIILPIWEKLRAGGNARLDIKRARVGDERLVGVVVPPGRIRQVLSDLNAAGAATTEDRYDALLEGKPLRLESGIQIVKTNRNGSPALLLKLPMAPSASMKGTLRDLNLITQQNFSRPEYFISMEREDGIRQLASLLEVYPALGESVIDDTLEQKRKPRTKEEIGRTPGRSLFDRTKWKAEPDLGQLKTSPKLLEELAAAAEHRRIPELQDIGIEAIETNDATMRLVEVAYDLLGNKVVSDGSAMPPAAARAVAGKIDQIAQAIEALQMPGENIRSVAKSLRAAADASEKPGSFGSSVIVINTASGRSDKDVYTTALHEIFHYQQRAAFGYGDRTHQTLLEDDPLFERLSLALVELGYTNHENFGLEAPAFAASEEYSALGLTRDEAREYMKRYFIGVARAGGPFALTRFNIVGPTFYDVLIEAKYDLTRNFDQLRQDRGAEAETSGGEGRTQKALDEGQGGVLEGRRRSGQPGGGRSLRQDALFSLRDPIGFKDIAAGSKGFAEKVRQSLDDFRTLMSPHTRSLPGAAAGRTSRVHMAKMARKLDQLDETFADAHKMFNKLSRAEKYAFIDAIEEGTWHTFPGHLPTIASQMRHALDDARDEIQALGTGKLANYYDNYFPHIWADPLKASRQFADFFKRNPWEGSKGFLKKRKIMFLRDGIAMGLDPISDNPVDLMLLKLREMYRYKMAHDVIRELTSIGLVRRIKFSHKVPSGWAKFDDSVSTLWGRPTGDAGSIWGWLVAPQEVANVVNNFLSRGLGKYPWYRAATFVNNFVTQQNLGYSTFHLFFTSLDAIISRMALGIFQAMKGEPGAALKTLAGAPLAFITNPITGAAVRHAWRNPTSTAPIIKSPLFRNALKTLGAIIEPVDTHVAAQLLEEGGARIQMDNTWRTNARQKWKQATADWKDDPNLWRSLKIVGLTPPALAELFAWPLMEYVVPRQKIGVGADAMLDAMRRNPGMTISERRAVMQTIWASDDNRMGQAVYDNYFWNRKVKDILHLSVRAVGWTYGLIAENAGGVVDTAKYITNVATKGVEIASGGRIGGGGAIPPHRRTGQFSEGWFTGAPEPTYRMAYVFALAAFSAITGSLIHYLIEKRWPRNWREMLFPGGFSLPTYVKDWAHFILEPGRTVVNKLAPVPHFIGDIYQNQDYFGEEIWSQDGTPADFALETGKYIGKQVLPFGVTGFLEAEQRGRTKGQAALSLLGMTPAPKVLTESKAIHHAKALTREQLPTGSRTHEEAALQKERARIRNLFKRGNVNEASESMGKLIREGRIDQGDAERIHRSAYEDPLILATRALPVDKFLTVWDEMTPEERVKMRPILEQKGDLIKNLPPVAQFAVRQRWSKAMMGQ